MKNTVCLAGKGGTALLVVMRVAVTGVLHNHTIEADMIPDINHHWNQMLSRSLVFVTEGIRAECGQAQWN